MLRALAILTLGFITTATLFCLAFLMVIARLKPWVTLGMSAGVAVFLVSMAKLLTLTYPSGLVDPWLFG